MVNGYGSKILLTRILIRIQRIQIHYKLYRHKHYKLEYNLNKSNAFFFLLVNDIFLLKLGGRIRIRHITVIRIQTDPDPQHWSIVMYTVQ